MVDVLRSLKKKKVAVTVPQILLFIATVRIRIRKRVSGGSQGVFACPNHDTDQPCMTVQKLQ